jgi:hypothetical protein
MSAGKCVDRGGSFLGSVVFLRERGERKGMEAWQSGRKRAWQRGRRRTWYRGRAWQCRRPLRNGLNLGIGQPVLELGDIHVERWIDKCDNERQVWVFRM